MTWFRRLLQRLRPTPPRLTDEQLAFLVKLTVASPAWPEGRRRGLIPIDPRVNAVMVRELVEAKLIKHSSSPLGLEFVTVPAATRRLIGERMRRQG